MCCCYIKCNFLLTLILGWGFSLEKKFFNLKNEILKKNFFNFKFPFCLTKLRYIQLGLNRADLNELFRYRRILYLKDRYFEKIGIWKWLVKIDRPGIKPGIPDPSFIPVVSKKPGNGIGSQTWSGFYFIFHLKSF
jgi:hypothetical protein